MTPTQILLAAVTEAVQGHARWLDAALHAGQLTSLTIELKIGHKTGTVRDVCLTPEIRSAGAGPISLDMEHPAPVPLTPTTA